MFKKQTIADIDMTRQTVLVRVDFNVPLRKDGTIADDLRIRASIPTIQHLIDEKCRVVLVSHLGRPHGKDSSLSLEVVAPRLAELLNMPVRFVDDCKGDKVRQVVRHSAHPSVTLLENVRFYDEEKADDRTFAHEIVQSTGARYFVQDGFGVVHRVHATTHAIAQTIPAVAGFLLEKEYTTITRAMEHPKRPLVAIIGGAKIGDKISLITRLVDIADTILIGGAMANTFLAYKGYKMGASLVEEGQTEVIREIYDLVEKKVGKEKVDEFLQLPTDVAVGTNVDEEQLRRELPVDKLSSKDMALDIGTETINRFTDVIKHAKTIIWNGPVGYSTLDCFAIGSARVAMAAALNTEAVSITGGGDTADFVLKWDGHDGASFTHVSTGGGASMELMAGKRLPGVDVLLDAHGRGVLH